jgi:glycosyltransferase involved in cell wall biosynthesis
VNQPPLVSIVLPIYKPGHLFDAALKTILSQTYSHWELVISVDGEFDEKILPADDRIRCVYNRTGNTGIFPNLNNAIRHANGGLLQIFCQDDLMYPHFIAAQANMLMKHPDCQMIFCSYRVVSTETEIAADEAEVKKINEGRQIAQHMSCDYFMNSLFSKGCMPGNLSPVMLRKTLLDEVGLFSEEYQYCGDYEMWGRIAKKHNTLYLKEQLLAVRVHAQQASNTLPLGVKINEMVRIYKYLMQHNTIPRSRAYLSWYANQHTGMSLFYQSLRQNFKMRFRNRADLRYFMKFPYNTFKILTLYAITGLGRFRVFKITPQQHISGRQAS